MQYRRFGKTDLLVSEIGFGAWAIGGAARVGDTAIGWGDADDNTSEKAVRAAIEAGINFFDTADFYGLGHSENLLGKTLKERKEIIIATKVGHRSVDNKVMLDYSKKYIIQACEESLKRLGREAIDYYQLHSARLQHLQEGDCIEAMETLKQQGKIRFWGLSLNTFHPEAEADYLIKNKLGDGFQTVFNLINQRALPVIEKAAANGYGIIARMPLQFGLLTGKFLSNASFAKDDHRSFRLTPAIIEKTNQLVQEKIAPLSQQEGLNATQMALSYILSFPEISTIIPGIRTSDQVHQNTEGLKLLTNANKAKLKALAIEWEPIVQLMEKQG